MANELTSPQGNPAQQPARVPHMSQGLQVPLEMSTLKDYEAKLSALTSITHHNGPLYMQHFLEAFSLAASFSAKITHELEKAKDASKRARAVAHLRTAHEWLAANGKKVTESACEQYVEMDHDYAQARELEAYLKALSEYLEKKVELFKAAHDDVKKIFDKINEPVGSSSAASSR